MLVSLASLFALSSAVAAVPARGPAWTTLTPIPVKRQEHTSVTLHDKIWMVGGILEDLSTTPRIDVYDPSTNAWTSSLPAPMPLGLNHPNVAVVKDKIYVLGGLALNADGFTWGARNDSFEYSPRTNVWTRLPDFPAAAVPRGSASMGVAGDVIVLAGGMKALVLIPEGLQDTVATVSAFNVRTRKWLPASAIPDMPAPRDHAGAVVVGKTLYVVGGRDHGQHNVRGTVFSLDLRSRLDHGQPKWKVLNTTMPTPRGGLSAAAVGKKIYTFGGEGNPEAATGVFPQVEAYDLKTNKWSKLADMTSPRHGTSATALNGKIYIPGGGDLIGGNPMDINEVWG